jgi:Spx/MgsR family transcriptional regulator
MYTLYGIKNCDTVRKARKWLEKGGINYHFHDFRIDGIDEKLLKNFVSSLGWEKLLNKRSTSWKQLDNEKKTDLTEEKAIALMLEIPTLIKRPVLDTGDQILAGFNQETYQQLL